MCEHWVDYLAKASVIGTTDIKTILLGSLCSVQSNLLKGVPTHSTSQTDRQVKSEFVNPIFLIITEGSLEVKLPTIWTVEKQR